MTLDQIVRTGRKRRRKRLIIALTGLGALGLAGLSMHFMAQNAPLSSGDGASVQASDPVPQGPVTFDEADAAMAEAEGMQTLVGSLGEAVGEAGLTDMSAFNILLNQTVGVVSAANEMLDAVDLGAEDSAKSARTTYHQGLTESRKSIDLVLAQLESAGVNVAALRPNRTE